MRCKRGSCSAAARGARCCSTNSVGRLDEHAHRRQELVRGVPHVLERFVGSRSVSAPSHELHDEAVFDEAGAPDLATHEAVGQHDRAAVRADGDHELVVDAAELHVGARRER